MSKRNDCEPDGSPDPEQVGEAASITFKELRAKLSELRFVEDIEQQLLARNSPRTEPKDPADN